MDRIRWDIGSDDPLVKNGPHESSHGRRALSNRKSPPASFRENGLDFRLVEISKDNDRGFYLARCPTCRDGFIPATATYSKDGSIKIAPVESMCAACDLRISNSENGENESIDPYEWQMQSRYKEAWDQIVKSTLFDPRVERKKMLAAAAEIKAMIEAAEKMEAELV